MPHRETDPYMNYRFSVECDGLKIGAFSEVSGFNIEVASADYREGNEAARNVRKLPGLAKYGNITLKKGVLKDEMYQWIIKGAKDGNIERNNLTIKLNDEANTEVAVWQIINAWPVKYSVSEFKAQGNEVLMETLELTHEGTTRTK